MKRFLSRQRTVMALIVLALALPFAAGAAYLFNKHHWGEGLLAEVEPRYARLLGLEASQAELNQAINESTAVLARYVYPASQDVSQAGNDAQQRIRDIATRAGLSIVSSQVLPPKAEGQFDRVPLTVRLEGELPALQSALVVLAGQSPAIIFESFSVQTIGAVKAEVPQRLGIQFNLFVLRTKESVVPSAAAAPVPAAASGAQPAPVAPVAASTAPSATQQPAPAPPVASSAVPSPAAPPPPVAAAPAPAPQAGGASFGGGATFGAPARPQSPARSAP